MKRFTCCFAVVLGWLLAFSRLAIAGKTLDAVKAKGYVRVGETGSCSVSACRMKKACGRVWMWIQGRAIAAAA